MLVQLRPSSEAFPIPYTPLKGVAEAALYCAHRGAASSHSLLHDPSLLIVGWSAWSPIARVQRGPSEAARCASTGDQQATPLPPSLTRKRSGDYSQHSIEIAKFTRT
jgi:hypothetical protein